MSDHLSALEQLVLLALLRVGDDAYGVVVQREIARRTGREPALGTIYAALARLEQKQFVDSEFGVPTAERGGRRKRVYVLRAAGRRALAESIRDLRVMARGLAIGDTP